MISRNKTKWKQQTELSKKPMTLNHFTLMTASSSEEPEEEVSSMRNIGVSYTAMQTRSRSVHKNAGSLEEDNLYKKLHVTKSSTRKRKANSIQHTGKCKSSRKNDLASSSTSEEVGAGTSSKRNIGVSYTAMQTRSRSVHKNAGSLEEDNLYKILHVTKSSTRKRKANSIQHTGKCKSSRKNDLASSSTFEEVGAGTSSKRSSPNEAVMPVDRDANEYNMQHQNRGRAVIFNHDKFDKRCKPRKGSKHDIKRLKMKFSSLGFKVTVNNNCTMSQIKRIISNLAVEDYSNDDCLVVIVLTHGNVDGDLIPKEGNISYGVEVLWEPLTSDKCPTLAGKPKLFFIQACRGSKVDVGTQLKHESRKSDEIDSNTSSYSIPTHADFLIAHSTVEGFTSIRNRSNGTWFIQGLCEELNTTDSLQQILTKTTRRIALQKSSHPKKYKQVPSITTTLTRELYFHPKNF